MFKCTISSTFVVRSKMALLCANKIYNTFIWLRLFEDELIHLLSYWWFNNTVFLSLKAKQVELQFTVGDAITSAAIGTSSVAARDPWTCTEDQYSPPNSEYNQPNKIVFLNQSALWRIPYIKSNFYTNWTVGCVCFCFKLSFWSVLLRLHFLFK